MLRDDDAVLKTGPSNKKRKAANQVVTKPAPKIFDDDDDFVAKSPKQVPIVIAKSASAKKLTEELKKELVKFVKRMRENAKQIDADYQFALALASEASTSSAKKSANQGTSLRFIFINRF